MYYYLGIVLDKDWESGWIFPTYVLGMHPRKKNVIAMRKQDREDYQKNRQIEKILFAKPFGKDNDYYVDFMSQPWIQSDEKFIPEGYLCYFACDHYGKNLKYGEAVVVKHVPVNKKRRREKESLPEKESPIFSKLFTEEPLCIAMEPGFVKPRFCQYRYKKETKNNE